MGMIGNFLNRINTPGVDGATGFDRLNALGMILQDHGDDAQTFMTGRQAAYAKAQAAAARDQFGKKLGGMIGAQYKNGPDPTVSVPQVGGGMPDDVNMGGFMPSIQKPAGGPLDPGMSVPASSGGEPWRYQPPVKISDGLNANSPELPGLLMEAQNAGYNMDDLLKVFQMQKPEAPKVIEGPDGIYRETPDHGFNKVQPYAPTIPFGWEIGPDGNPRPRKGGPADPAYIGQTAGIRRDAVIARPMPGRAKAVNPNAIKWD